jgi:uncharacterized protein YecE (DUF72 family)
VYVYFDNDIQGRAPYDAVALLERLDAAPTPPAREIPPARRSRTRTSG